MLGKVGDVCETKLNFSYEISEWASGELCSELAAELPFPGGVVSTELGTPEIQKSSMSEGVPHRRTFSKAYIESSDGIGWILNVKNENIEGYVEIRREIVLVLS